MNHFYNVSKLGELYVPRECRESVFARPRVKYFAARDLIHLGRISTHLSKGGVAVVEGRWEQILVLMDYIERHQKSRSNRTVSHKGSRYGEVAPKRRKSAGNLLDVDLTRLMCWADADGVLQVDPPLDLPYLLELIGEPSGANEGCPFLVPLACVERVRRALEVTYPVGVLGVSLVASEHVLAPRSQETVACFQEALQDVFANVLKRSEIEVVDVGCGSGVLTLLAHQESPETAIIYASDLLPEAVATTKLNVEEHLPDSGNIRIMPAGDLFVPFGTRQFDLILFNAPWVVVRARNRGELAIHDEKQQTLKRFFKEVRRFLKPDGIILLGYADASGRKAIENLEGIIESAGMTVADVFKRRVATHRAKRKWEQIQVSVLIQ